MTFEFALTLNFINDSLLCLISHTYRKLQLILVKLEKNFNRTNSKSFNQESNQKENATKKYQLKLFYSETFKNINTFRVY